MFNKISHRGLITGAAALASYKALGQSINQQIGGGIGNSFDGALGSAGKRFVASFAAIGAFERCQVCSDLEHLILKYSLNYGN